MTLINVAKYVQYMGLGIFTHSRAQHYYVVPNSRACTAIYFGKKCSPTRPY